MKARKVIILLIIQITLISIGLFVQMGIFNFILVNKLNSLMLVSSLVLILAHFSAIAYGLYGFKKGTLSYNITIVLFLIAILINIILPFRDYTQKILLVLLFGLMSIFLVKRDNHKFTNYILLFATIVCLAFSIYTAIVANYNSLGEVKLKELAVILMYLSIFTPVLFISLFGVSYNTRSEENKFMK